jgi:WD40 repeat protein
MAAITKCSFRDNDQPGGEIMPMQPDIRTYLKNISRELGEIDPAMKKSVLQEIEEHLNEKMEEAKSSTKVKDLSSDSISKIIDEFGEPDEIAKEYHRQLSDERGAFSRRKSSGKKVMAISIVTIIIVILLIIAGFRLIGQDNDKDENDGPEGPWLQSIAWKPGGDYFLIVGEGMPVTKSDGTTKEHINSPVNIKYYDITWQPDGDYALICGSGGTILKYDGTKLTDLSIQVEDTLWSIKFHPGGVYALAAGANGVVGVVFENQSSYTYVPDNVVRDIDINDVAWSGDGSQVLLVGNDPDKFSKGIMLTFSPGMSDLLNGNFSVLSTPETLSTCFSAHWVEDWDSFIVTANMAKLYKITSDWTVTEIPNDTSDVDPIFDAVWNPTQNRLILAGGLAGWNAAKGIYDMERATRYVLSTDGQTVSLIDKGEGPHFLACEWNPVDNTVIFIGAFGVVYEAKNGEVAEVSIGF